MEQGVTIDIKDLDYDLGEMLVLIEEEKNNYQAKKEKRREARQRRYS